MKSKRNPFVAFFLSIFAAGAGQIYNGQVIKGIIIFLLSISYLFIIALTGIQYTLSGFIVVAGLLPIMFLLYVHIDAIVVSFKRKEYTLNKYNKWYIYLFLIVIASGLQLTIDKSEIINVEIATISGPSMEPTLFNNDKVFIDMREGNNFNPGDIILFETPNKDTYIKRIIAVGGDKIEHKGDRIFVNGEEIYEPYIKNEPYEDYKLKIEVPQNHVYVLGDNRRNSTDSRLIGNISTENIKGKVIYIIYSNDKTRIKISN